MSEPTAAAPFIFPPALVGRRDLTRVLRELEQLDNELESQKARSHGEAQYHMPAISQVLNDMLTTNKVDIANDQTRMKFREQLRKLKDHAPVIHMTFAAEADPGAIQQIVAWIRQELHPQALISVGLQPSLIGGVYVRTPNHVHDFSLREHMKGKRDVIVQSLEQISGGVQ